MKTRGMTLVELLVAMAVGLLVVAVAVAALVASQRGARGVDAASQLRDDARFAASIIQRLGVQTGFEDVQDAANFYRGEKAEYRKINRGDVNIEGLLPNVYGYNNAVPSSTDPINNVSVRRTGSEGYGSDILILQNQTVALDPDLDPRKSTASDQSMIN